MSRTWSSSGSGLGGVLPAFLQAVDESLFDDRADVAVDAADSG
jgi:hypothetical protein